MIIGVTGPRGHVGKVLVEKGATPLNFHIGDKKDVASIRREVKKASPDIVINTICKSSVNWCEALENQEEVIKTNLTGVFVLASVLEELHIPLIVLSTDHIFDGKRGPYKENGRKMLPVNYYGASKLAMETLMLGFDGTKIVRTSNLFSRDDSRINWYLDESYKMDKVKVPIFQKRSFMHIEHYVDNLLWYVDNYERMPKFLNISGSKTVDWLTFLRAFCDAVEFPFKDKFVKKWFDDKNMVPRPKKAGLDTSLSAKLGMKQYSYLDGMELL